MSETLLECQDLNKAFFGVRVLRDVGLALAEGQVCGIVGENGAGKSTLMNILGGVLAADSGRMLLRGEAYAPRNPAEAGERGIAFIHQELNLFNNLSVAENLCLGSFPRRRILGLPFLNKPAMLRRARSLLASVDLHVDPGTLVEDLSPGQRQLVEIAKALGSDAKIIIFDEPTTSLTAREAEGLFAIIERLRSQGIAMIYISHALGEVLRLCDQIVVLRDGQVVGTGPRSDFTMQRMISLMVGRTIDQLYPPRRPSVTDQVVLNVEGLSQPGVVADINLTLHRGEVLGLFGLMGSGRSELARILFGLDSYRQGEIILNGLRVRRPRPRESIRRALAFLTENRREEGLLMDAAVSDNIALVSLPSFAGRRHPLLHWPALRRAVAERAAEVRLTCASLDRQSAKTLSGGNQQKVVLAKWLLAHPSVLILDEPTRGIDVGAKQEIYGLINDLAARGAAILLISSEIEELIGMCDRILVMTKGEIRGGVERKAFDRERMLAMALDTDGR
jgi:ribose transport system ATP-binding protein